MDALSIRVEEQHSGKEERTNMTKTASYPSLAATVVQMNCMLFGGVGFLVLALIIMNRIITLPVACVIGIGWSVVFVWVRNEFDKEEAHKSVPLDSIANRYLWSFRYNIFQLKTHPLAFAIIFTYQLFFCGIGFAAIIGVMSEHESSTIFCVCAVVWTILTIWSKVHYDYWMLTKDVDSP